MALPSVFDAKVAEGLIARINTLTPTSQPKWGKMDVARMLAHSNVTYEYAFDERTDRPNFIVKTMLKTFVKPKVIGDAPYEQNSPTGPAFIIKSDKDFEEEKQRLVNYINKIVQTGKSAYEGKESASFGVLTSGEWSNMIYKHIDHHLTQFGV